MYLKIVLTLVLFASFASNSAAQGVKPFVQRVLLSDDATLTSAQNDVSKIGYSGTEASIQYAKALCQTVLQYRSNFRQLLALLSKAPSSLSRYSDEIIPMEGSAEDYYEAVIRPDRDSYFMSDFAPLYFSALFIYRASFANNVYQILKAEGGHSKAEIGQWLDEIEQSIYDGLGYTSGKTHDILEQTLSTMQKTVNDERMANSVSKGDVNTAGRKGKPNTLLSGQSSGAEAQPNKPAGSTSSPSSSEVEDATYKAVKTYRNNEIQKASAEVVIDGSQFPKELIFPGDTKVPEAQKEVVSPTPESVPMIPELPLSSPLTTSSASQTLLTGGVKDSEPIDDKNPPRDSLFKQAWDAMSDVGKYLKEKGQQLLTNYDTDGSLLKRLIDGVADSGSIEKTSTSLTDRLKRGLVTENLELDTAQEMRNFAIYHFPFFGSGAIKGIYDYGKSNIDRLSKLLTMATTDD